MPGTTGTPARMRRLASRGLAPHQRNRFGRGADEGQLRVPAGASEGRILREEAIAGMDGIRTGAPRRIEQGLDPQVTLRRLTRTDVKCLIGLADVTRIPIAVRVDRDRRQAQFAARPDDPDSNLAAVGDQNFHEAQERRAGHSQPLGQLGHLTRNCSRLKFKAKVLKFEVRKVRTLEL